MIDRYFSIKKSTEGIYKEKGSKFLSFAFPVANENEIKDRLQAFKKKYYDARHICYAFILGPSGQIFNCSDAGEPSHTAGDPILNKIRSAGISDILIVVVRYFGGTKLGKSGLIHAYREAAEDSLTKSEKIEKQITHTFKLNFAYNQTQEVMNLINHLEGDIIHQTFTDSCSLEVRIRKSLAEEAQKKLAGFFLWEPL